MNVLRATRKWIIYYITHPMSIVVAIMIAFILIWKDLKGELN